jgi:hypothetical protein
MSKKNERRKRAHDGKRSFATQAAADAAIRSWESNGLHGLASYECPFGGHWHAGHKKKSRNTKTDLGASPSSD